MQDTNLKISPYFDDFDSSKNYQKVLFKPGYSVQTRELNSLQSILQNQVERFGQHVFKDGSLVIPGNVNYTLSLKCVLVQPFINGISVETYRQSLVGKTLTGATSGVKAEVIETLSQSESEKDTITLYITYNYSGVTENGVQVKEFKNNETLIDDNGTAVAVTTVQNASAYSGSTVTLNAGVYFVRGFFVEVLKQKIILDQYSNEPSYKVGLQVNESIATTEEDETLFDNSLGSTNYAAPGADRLKIDLKLVKQDLLFTENSNFIELIRFDKGNVTQSAASQFSAYAELERNLARRTFDESGSYTIRPYTIKVREALDDGENGGVFKPNEVLYDGRTIVTEIPTSGSTNSSSDDNPRYIIGSDHYVVELSEGKAYVEGFEVVNDRKQYAVVPKPRNHQSLNNQGIILDIGSYIKIDNTTPIQGGIKFNETVFLRDADDVVIGRAKSLGFTSNYRLYLADVNVYEKLTLVGDHNFTSGDFITGTISGATAFVESVSGADSQIITLRQVTGTFVSTDKIKSSRFTTLSTNPSIGSIQRYSLENVRTVVTAVGSNQFVATVKLDNVSISGSSFTVTGGTTLTGLDTSFDFELTSKSKIKLGDQTAVEVDSVTSTSVTLSSSVTNDTYYSAFKEVCKLYSSSSGLSHRLSPSPVKEQSGATHNRLICDTGYTVNSNGEVTIQSGGGSTIDTSSIVVTNGSTTFTNLTYNQTDTNTVTISGISGLSSGSPINVYYKNQISNPTKRTKSLNSFKFLMVDKVKNSTNHVYGTRISDKEISLKYPDVIKIHGIHQSINDADSTADLFDRIVLNEASQILVGDIITSGTIKAKVISKNGNTLYVIYTSSSKFQSGENLTISVNVPNNSNAVGLFIRQSFYGRYLDITDDFNFIRNDDKDFYKVSKLVRKTNSAEPNRKFVVIYDYFSHEDLNNDYYSIESHRSDVDSGILYYDKIPASFNGVYMTDILDYRLYSTPSGGTNDGSIGSPFTETVSAFDTYLSTFNSSQPIPYPTSISTSNYDFYLGRVDKVYLTTGTETYDAFTGLLRVVPGSDAISPSGSDDPGAGLLLATIKLPPYLRKVTDATIKKEKTRGYTMRDIGKLEDRLSNVEKYTSLSLLEVNTNNLNILDEEGRNRFKNGFVVDSFTNTNVADLKNPDYTASIDLDKNIVRPYPYVNNVGLTFSTNSTALKNDTHVTIPYNQTPYISQPYASRVENLVPYEIFSWVGNMEVIPKKDIWYDTQRTIEASQNINLTDPFEELLDLAVPGGQIWGDWELGAGGSTNVAGGTNITDIQTGTQFEVNPLSFEIESGDTINSIEDIRFSRSRIININTTGLKPNTKFFFYINEKESSNIIYPKLLRNLTEVTGTFVIGEKVSIQPIFNDNLARTQVFRPITATVIDPTVLDDTVSTTDNTILGIDQIRSADDTDINPEQIGDSFRIIGDSSGARATSKTKQELISDQYGNLNAFVLLPSETFETGDLTLSLSDLSNNYQIKGITGSYATGFYYSQGTQLSVTSNVTTLEVPELTATAITQDRTRFIADPPPPAPRRDPIAQSFFVDEEGGIFVTSISLFFLTKDPVAPVTVDIRTVENGNPTSYIMPGTVSTVQSADVNTSIDASVPTTFTFKNPVYLNSNSDYCFVVRSTTSNYNMWVSRLGEEDVTTGLKIDKQPYVGVLYKSSNQSAWTPDQYEDIKFDLNRAQFTTGTSYTAVFPNKKVENQKLITNPFTFSSGSSTIKVFQPNHGMHQINNKVLISNVGSDTTNAQVANSPSLTSNAEVISIKNVTGVAFDPSNQENWNRINGDLVSTTNPGYIKIDDEIISYTGISGSQLTGCTRGALSTIAEVHSNGAVVQCFQNNGVILSDLNKLHTVSAVNSLDEYEIILGNNANESRKSGGRGVLASRNIQYESITPHFNIFNPPNTESSISMISVSGTSIGNSKQKSFSIRGSQSIENGVENLLTEPRLVLSDSNKKVFTPGQEGTITSTITISTTNDRLSPIIDIEGSSITTISNRINKEVDSQGDLDLSSELTPIGGKHSAYITKKVLLETSSTSVKVLFDGIRTSNNDIKVFVKIKGDSSPGSFVDMNYIEIPSVSYPTSETRSQYRAFDYEIKGLREFKEFSVKVVMIGNDQSDCPKIRNFRALALAL